MNPSKLVKITYFSDVLCVWAYVAQRRLDELRNQFGSQIKIECHYLPIFGNTQVRIGEGWNNRGGYAAYGQHVLEVAKQLDYVDIHPKIWAKNIPASSMGCHLFLKAIQLLEESGEIAITSQQRPEGRGLHEEAAWQMRLAFFRDLKNVAELQMQLAIAEQLALPLPAIMQHIESGAAYAALSHDLERRDQLKLEGSPTFVLNEGRQKLYGNVGYRIIEANVQELLTGAGGLASWC